jgi:hypothetical protein
MTNFYDKFPEPYFSNHVHFCQISRNWANKIYLGNAVSILGFQFYQHKKQKQSFRENNVDIHDENIFFQIKNKNKEHFFPFFPLSFQFYVYRT